MKFSRIDKKKGSGASPIKSRYAFLYLKKDIEYFPPTDEKGVRLLGDIVLKTDCQVIPIYLTNSSQEYSFDSNGNDDEKTFRVKFSGTHPGTELQASEFVKNMLEEEFLIYIPGCDKDEPGKILGQMCNPMVFTSSHKASKDGAKFTFNFEQRIGSEFIYYSYGGIIEIPTDTGNGNQTGGTSGIGFNPEKYYTKVESDDRFQPKGNYANTDASNIDVLSWEQALKFVKQSTFDDTVSNIEEDVSILNSKFNGIIVDIDGINQEIDGLKTQDQNLIQHYNDLNSLVSTLTDWKNEFTGSDSDDVVNRVDEIIKILEGVKENDNLLALINSSLKAGDVVDSLVSIDISKPLSANQGRILKNLYDSIKSIVDGKLDIPSMSDKNVGRWDLANKRFVDGTIQDNGTNIGLGIVPSSYAINFKNYWGLLFDLSSQTPSGGIPLGWSGVFWNGKSLVLGLPNFGYDWTHNKKMGGLSVDDGLNWYNSFNFNNVHDSYGGACLIDTGASHSGAPTDYDSVGNPYYKDKNAPPNVYHGFLWSVKGEKSGLISQYFIDQVGQMYIRGGKYTTLYSWGKVLQDKPDATTTLGSVTNYPKVKFAVDSTTQGAIIAPRMTTAQRNAITGIDSTQKGMVVFDTDNGFFFKWTGTSWDNIGANISNADLTNTVARIFNQGASFTWDTRGNPYFLKGLLDKTSDSSYSKVLKIHPTTKEVVEGEAQTYNVNNPSAVSVTVNHLYPTPAPNYSAEYTDLQTFIGNINNYTFSKVNDISQFTIVKQSSVNIIMLNGVLYENTNNNQQATVQGTAFLNQIFPNNKNFIIRLTIDRSIVANQNIRIGLIRDMDMTTIKVPDMLNITGTGGSGSGLSGAGKDLSSQPLTNTYRIIITKYGDTINFLAVASNGNSISANVNAEPILGNYRLIISYVPSPNSSNKPFISNISYYLQP